MTIEPDEEFLALCRERFKAYGQVSPDTVDYWIAGLLATQQLIRQALKGDSDRWAAKDAEACDLETAKWAMWSIQTNDVGATPTEPHRIWSAIRSAIMCTRMDERERIAAALHGDLASTVGKTAMELIEAHVCRSCESGS